MLRPAFARPLGRLLAVALPLYFAWEMAQAPFFTGMPAGWVRGTLMCAQATLGDGVLVAAVAIAGTLLYRDRRWFVPPAPLRYVVAVVVGVALQIAVEWVMVYRLNRWGYASNQPILPLVGLGILPVLQPIVLLPLTFWLTARWEGTR
jgi:hypothetical protein